MPSGRPLIHTDEFYLFLREIEALGDVEIAIGQENFLMSWDRLLPEEKLMLQQMADPRYERLPG